MLSILPFKWKRSRKYPIKKDRYGESARKRSFAAFDDGRRPADVAAAIGISKRTAYRYHASWKKLPANACMRYELVKKMKRDEELLKETVSVLASSLDMSEEEVLDRLQKPWGLKELLMGKWPNHRDAEKQSDFEYRLQSALDLVRLAEQAGNTPEEAQALIRGVIENRGSKHKTVDRQR